MLQNLYENKYHVKQWLKKLFVKERYLTVLMCFYLLTFSLNCAHSFKIFIDEPWLVELSGLSASCKPKGRFNSQSGHMPGLQAKSPVPSGGPHERQPHIDVSLPLSPTLPLCPKIHKSNFKKSKYKYLLVSIRNLYLLEVSSCSR